MSYMDKVVIIILVIAVLITLSFAKVQSKEHCSVSEFGPDTPAHVKQKCRGTSGEKI
jgi:hypothetical protein